MRHLVRCIRIQHERQRQTATNGTGTTPGGPGAGGGPRNAGAIAASAVSATQAAASAAGGSQTPTLAHRVPMTSNYDAMQPGAGIAASAAAGANGKTASNANATQDLIKRLDPVLSTVLIRPPWHSLVRCARPSIRNLPSPSSSSVF